MDIAFSLIIGAVSLLAWLDADEWWQYAVAIFGGVMFIVTFVASFI